MFNLLIFKINKMKKIFLESIRIIVISIISFFSLGIVFATWTAPALPPPDGNVLTPINVGPIGQEKEGNFFISGLNASGTPYANGLIIANGNVGIGTITPSAKLEVSGDIISKSGILNINGATSIYDVQEKHYHIEATKAKVGNTVPLDMNILRQMCSDFDGCQVTIGMRNWDSVERPGLTSSRGPYTFFMAPGGSNWWRLSNDTEGKDGNGGVTHALVAWGCYFTDGEYTNYSPTDNSIGFGLLNWTEYSDLNMVCTLDISGTISPSVKIKSQTFYTNGVWTRPPGVDTVSVIVCGGGGGGGGYGTYCHKKHGGGGGGGGASDCKKVNSYSVAGNVSVSVGGGGGAGTTGQYKCQNGNPGGNGDNSSFGTIIAPAGTGGGGGGKGEGGGSPGGFGGDKGGGTGGVGDSHDIGRCGSGGISTDRYGRGNGGNGGGEICNIDGVGGTNGVVIVEW